MNVGHCHDKRKKQCPKSRAEEDFLSKPYRTRRKTAVAGPTSRAPMISSDTESVSIIPLLVHKCAWRKLNRVKVIG